MALLHEGKDIASRGDATSIVRWATRGEVTVLFGNLVGLWLGVPALHAQHLPPLSALCVLLAAVALWLGLGAPAGPAPLAHLSTPARHTYLLLLVPALLGAGASACWSALGPGVGPGALTLGLSILGLWAYAAACLRGDRRGAVPAELVVQGMDGESEASTPPKRPLVLGLLYGAGALALASHPAASGGASGASAANVAWHMLTATCASALAATVAGLHLGTALRRPRTSARPVLPHVLVVVTGLMTYLVLLRLG